MKILRGFVVAKKYVSFVSKSFQMSNQVLYSKMQLLQSEELKRDLLLYIEFLLTKQKTENEKRIPVFGSAKGTFKMSPDFDEPLDDFKDYMPE